MNNTDQPLRRLGIRAMFLVWGFPFGTRRSQFMAQLLGMDIEHVYITPRQGAWYALVKYPVQALKTLIVLARRRPQVVFIQDPPILAILVVYLWGLFTGARYVIDSHTDALLAPWWAWSLSLHGFLSRKAITTIVTNDHLQQMVASWNAHAFVLTDVPVVLSARRPVELDKTKFNIVVISTASYDEPIAEIFQAAKGLPNVAFHVTGNYKNRQHIIQVAPDNVHFTGYVPDDTFYGLMEAAQVVMCLTTENHTIQSGAGEALWLGKPIITSCWPLLQQYFSKGTLHVDNTADRIYQAIVKMQENLPALKADILALQQERWRDWQNNANALVTLIHQALNTSRRTR